MTASRKWLNEATRLRTTDHDRWRSNITKLLIRGAAVLLCCTSARAQFSPGELSKAHATLEGMNNCLKCHESGNEISGAKCLNCHQEIQKGLSAKRGYHFNVSKQKCVECHKEHLGRNAPTFTFDKNTFDHRETGFVRTDKHATAACEKCHTERMITDAEVMKRFRMYPRPTYLGLSSACMSCHEDKHNSTVGKECQNCHNARAWSPVAKQFDHSKTAFRLIGTHATVPCQKCHTTLEREEKGTPLLFAMESFNDCTPCHTSPHSKGFATQRCNSCHVEEGWNSVRKSGGFNHDLTAFKLVGKHATVRCERCHTLESNSSGKRTMKLAHNRCVDCHADYHNGEFAVKFTVDCARCHTEFGFKPSTFTIAQHVGARFALDGAHVAIPCEKCHQLGSAGRKVFRFAAFHCESCHRDKHGGQFSAQMTGKSCAACHSTMDWSPKSFDHARTSFALVGKHEKVRCQECHETKTIGGVQTQAYKGTNSKCEGCHKDVHAGQFVAKGETRCESCHTPNGWKRLIFNHETESVFALTGAHKRVECRRCHVEERRADTAFVRYKPLSTKCESCHAQGTFGNG